ncbi:AraC family transcriptional regulator [Psychroserpens sp.]|uniref:helix-turn-helix domain-containing protein n=1 Tax=Psychroserpens sp. TaxID=2020870 RepID=UPI001B201C19|nr:AraC family transcriptional regulator [Psychroserpens sp.]MBO6606894.1 helix-turn-helix transcriptional regulator [Psychroserpens sp.]MBO6630576.1 helix-turn-helix transcriptional regulator [Psychroserpens sp.]MBO6654040.1 helix-turn-helix transcriptional regulator [Psychroserpens sp.]MBO6682674.1 helix-turn-helix transcriptional regulator [Psychroserpens sp.]MBO6750666.1 helix-turn-helix transcriptional regulator [Psychroserpens sp.]
MLKTIQIIALLQGFFLIFILLRHKRDYKDVNFKLLLGCILSVILYTIGDDDYNLFVNDSDWFLFHDTLIITFFFLFVRYYKSNKDKFNYNDLWFFTPYLLYIGFNAVKAYTTLNEFILFKIGKGIIEFSFMIMLIYTIYDIIKTKKEKWLLIFIAPLTLIFIIDELAFFATNSEDSPFFLDSYGILLAAIFLFYYVLYKLIIAPKDVLPKSETSKYKTSSLNAKNIEINRSELLRLMTEEKLFKNRDLTVIDVANQLNIPRQHLSEILNVHMKTGFQDLLNQYRIEEFIKCLENDTYKNYTLLGIANEVGFSSKSTFNTTFKKLKGMTPSQYKQRFV